MLLPTGAVFAEALGIRWQFDDERHSGAPPGHRRAPAVVPRGRTFQDRGRSHREAAPIAPRGSTTSRTGSPACGCSFSAPRPPRGRATPAPSARRSDPPPPSRAGAPR